MSAPEARERMRGGDWALLLGYTLLLFGYSVFDGRLLTVHETVHCLNTQEMLADGDWVIPHYGGRPWLERPPLPFWLTAGIVELVGHPEADWAYRIPPLVMGLIIVYLVAWMASVWYGRVIGLLTGLILVTMRQFLIYSTGPEADIFLCVVVTAALACLVRAEFGAAPEERERPLGFLGNRPWPVWAFFVLLGLTNMTKGLIFGTLWVAVPAGTFLLWQGGLRGLRRYVWLWGWLAFVAVAVAWPVLAWRRYPDIVALWESDYLGRLNQNYMREPWWYYFAQLPWLIFPWTGAAFLGLYLIRPRTTWRLDPDRPEDPAREAAIHRFLFCWAVVPILFFSIPKGKHHHYLLQCLAPWAVLASLGIVEAWRVFLKAPAWLRNPLPAVLCLGLPASAAVYWFRAKVPGPSFVPLVVAAGWPVVLAGFWWAMARPSGRLALATGFGLLLVVHWAGYSYRSHVLVWNSYGEDYRFLQRVCSLPAAAPLYIGPDDGPLGSSWWMFYCGGRLHLLHNLSYLRDERIRERELYLIARPRDEARLATYGTVEKLFASTRSRAERTPRDRFTLYRLTFREDLERRPPARISPMQATGRAIGPDLDTGD
jgi:4-amino-4-deoxy-L-arabinose transferase-like glycosyltransferase